MVRPLFIALIAAAVAFACGTPRDARAASWHTLNDALGTDLARFAPAVVSREQWKARPALPDMNPQRPAGIIIHHTAVAMNPKYPLETNCETCSHFRKGPRRNSGGAPGATCPIIITST